MNEDLATMRLRGVQNVVLEERSSSDVPSFINQFRNGRYVDKPVQKW